MTGAALIVQGDALHLPLPDGSVDAICTDPPYGLEFMGKDWDAPWQAGKGIGEHNAGFSPGAPAVPGVRGAIKALPSYLGGTNPTCRNCGGTRQGRDRQSRRRCACDNPSFPDVTGPRMLAYQAWCEQWAAEALRVLKPGGWLLAFGGTRTWHRLACGLEDAGFEMRDTIAEFGPGGDATEASYGPLAWVYGSGFPRSKSLDVSKAIDKVANALPLWAEIRSHIREWRDRNGMTNSEVNDALGLSNNGSGMMAHWTRTGPNQQAIPSKEMWVRLKALFGWPDCDLDDVYASVKDGADRPVIGEGPYAARRPRPGAGTTIHMPAGDPQTAPATPEAERWQGWGTALKPSWEPVIVARKPLASNVAQNVLTYGTGALNIDATRVGSEEITTDHTAFLRYGGQNDRPWMEGHERHQTKHTGRWPPNVALVHSEGCVPVGVRKVRSSGRFPGPESGPKFSGNTYAQDEYTRSMGSSRPEANLADPDGTETITAWECEENCPVGLLDQQSGERPTGNVRPYQDRSTSGIYGSGKGWHGAGGMKTSTHQGDQGGASRFFPTFQAESRLFYTAKAPRNERVTIDGDGHPTVKPLSLVRWLVRLITPPGGLILDMFGGSGTTGEAAMLEGFTCLVIDKDPASCAKAKVRAHPFVRQRIVTTSPPDVPTQGSLL